jgi:hypothetical protein
MFTILGTNGYFKRIDSIALFEHENFVYLTEVTDFHKIDVNSTTKLPLSSASDGRFCREISLKYTLKKEPKNYGKKVKGAICIET